MNELSRQKKVEVLYQLQYVEPVIVRDKTVASKTVGCPEDIVNILRELKYAAVEKFIGVYLDSRNHVLAVSILHVGGITETVVDPKIVFGMAFLCNATALVVVHNHPSGNNAPSDKDKEMTRKLVTCGDFLDIKLFDHIIIGSDGYYSFAESLGDELLIGRH